MNNDLKKLYNFFMPIFKPYWFYYFLISMESLTRGAYFFLNIYACKMFIDYLKFGTNNFYFYISIFLYLGTIVLSEIGQLMGHYAFLKSQPSVVAEMMKKIYLYVQNHSYTFFQNTLSG